MAKNMKQQVAPPQWSAASFALQPMPSLQAPHKKGAPTTYAAPAATPAKTQPNKAHGGPVIGAGQGKSVAVQGARNANASSFSSAPSFQFFKVPHQQSNPTINAPAASLPSFPTEAPLAHCPSYASCASNDAQEELNLHPSINKIKKKAPFEADGAAILQSAMGSMLATDVPDQWAERTIRQQNPLQKTESQLIQAHAQALALAEQRRRAQAEAAAQKMPSPIRALLAKRRVPQKIYLMRHGESEANISRRDVPDPNLTHLGLAQAKSWQETIGDFGADIVLVSPLRRAVMTACHAFQYEETPMLFCRFAREIGWSCNENTIHSTTASMNKLLDSLPRGDEVYGVKEALFAAPDDPQDEMASLQRLKVVLAGRPENTIIVVCHFGVIAATSGCRAKNGDIYECEWGYNDELRVVARHKTPLADQPCICG